MNTSTCCCLYPPPPNSTVDPTSSSPSLLSTKKHYARKANEKSSSSWRSKKLVVIATTIILNLEVGDITSNSNGSYYDGSIMANEISMESHQIPTEKRDITRWSDKRRCPPWKINSLETIVPENLPRPSAHRKWEEVSYSSEFVSPKSAPSIKFSNKPTSSCFSM